MTSRKYFEDLLINGNLKLLFKELLDFAKDKEDQELETAIILLYSRWQRNLHKALRSTISESEYLVEENQIYVVLINNIRKL